MLYGTDEREEREACSLSELNTRVREAVHRALPETYWVRAEMTDVRMNLSSGHCYLEFVEKHPVTGQLVAKARGMIWSRTFRMLKPYFEGETGQVFGSGLKVLVKVSVDFHELYGYNLTVQDIDPSYTLGDLYRKRMEIIRRLQEEGVYALNKELELPLLIQRIALVTSPTAAGYGDFMNQLQSNRAGYQFYVKLFPAIMQGGKTEESIIRALDRIYSRMDLFDVVVILRGGGSVADLNCFDSYALASHCAQFPLPVLTGIGHERDDSVVDLVAHTRMKTPTAVAEFLIAKLDETADELQELQERALGSATELLTRQKTLLRLLVTQLPVLAVNRLEGNRSLMQRWGNKLSAAANTLLNRRGTMLAEINYRLKNNVQAGLTKSVRYLDLTEQYIKMASPDYILKRGYSLTLKDGKIVKRADALRVGDIFVTRFTDGEHTGKVIK
ncbi:exodeoxyribonuclease VII large subunit [Parabacteroides sp. Marseille-P3160]|uniref:exodeoxyribonuclease VII large subunit n=1 Tax=Parabacteroides sp. Marseille-P3160 TaxID=1917887 RepID=UPI0009BB3658|nr:exodeoxyribonuclease VII large subunit [Parabacteroides sp. Marseille-P3160]